MESTSNGLLLWPNMRYVAGSVALVILSTVACSPAPEVIQWTLHWKDDGRWKLTGSNPSDRNFRVEWVLIVFLDSDGFMEGWDRRRDVTIPAFSKKTLLGDTPNRKGVWFRPEKAYLEFPNGNRISPQVRRHF